MATLPELARALERIRLIKGISHSETSIHLETLRTTTSATARAAEGAPNQSDS